MSSVKAFLYKLLFKSELRKEGYLLSIWKDWFYRGF